ncbi:endothelin-1 isoform 1-T2 [Menidia menidia]
MGSHAWVSVLWVMISWMFCTALSAPAAHASSAVHVRNKRCSCATFLDKECVYFCHLDIIWVNTPERVVSYGMGNAPRSKRALPDSVGTQRAARCRCLRETDGGCTSFCLRQEVASVETERRRTRAPGAEPGGPER